MQEKLKLFLFKVEFYYKIILFWCKMCVYNR